MRPDGSPDGPRKWVPSLLSASEMVSITKVRRDERCFEWAVVWPIVDLCMHIMLTTCPEQREHTATPRDWLAKGNTGVLASVYQSVIAAYLGTTPAAHAKSMDKTLDAVWSGIRNALNRQLGKRLLHSLTGFTDVCWTGAVYAGEGELYNQDWSESEGEEEGEEDASE
jgi:hypothetical protein